MDTGVSYEEHVTRVRSEAARIFNAVGASGWEEVPKPSNRPRVGERPLSTSGAFAIDTNYTVQGWFSVTFDGRPVPITVVQQYTNRRNWNTIILNANRGECASDQVFLEHVQEELRREARRVPV
ncbi:hypothetical protein [Sorangium sp. So ce887]|uniref:hypothetical protein n=1 Tax=Sorangium sp. So ce887 TaxID=3133324 RepID=UPI003F5E2A87